jgi:outer membrane protein assembly factor BamB
MTKTVFHLLIASCVLIASVCFSQAIDNPKIKWRFKTDGPIRGSAVVWDKNVIFGSADGYVYAINSLTGEESWRFNAHSPIVGSPGIDNSIVVVATRDNQVHALEPATGNPLWEFAMGGDKAESSRSWDYFTAAPVVHKEYVYIASGDGNLYALHKLTGQPAWRFATGGSIRAAPLVANNIIYQPSNDGFIYAVNTTTGQLHWKFATAGANLDSTHFGFDRNSIYTQPVLVSDTLIFGSRDGNVYALDSATGKQKWTFAYDTTWAMAITADSNTVYVGWSTNRLVSALDVKTGKELWQFKSGAYVYTTPLIDAQSIYFGSADGNVYNVNKNTGEEIWHYNIGYENYSSPIFTPDKSAIMFGSDNGYFYSLERGAQSHKAFFLPQNITGIGQYIVADKNIAPYLAERDFVQLDDQQLAQFITVRIADKEPSVVVFLYPIIPPTVLGKDPAKGLLRRYLETGGKVVWLGDIPNYFEIDSSNNTFKRDAGTGEKLLEVQFTHLQDSGNYYSKSTQAGKNWGLPAWLKTTATPVMAKGVTPLAYDEFNRVSAYVKSFNDRPGSGYVSLRTWAWYTPIRNEELALLHEIAAYGLE